MFRGYAIWSLREGISLRSPKNAAQLKPTDFRANLLLCLLFGLADSTIWWSFKWITQRCIFGFVLMSWKPNNKTFFAEFVRLEQIT